MQKRSEKSSKCRGKEAVELIVFTLVMAGIMIVLALGYNSVVPAY